MPFPYIQGGLRMNKCKTELSWCMNLEMEKRIDGDFHCAKYKTRLLKDDERQPMPCEECNKNKLKEKGDK